MQSEGEKSTKVEILGNTHVQELGSRRVPKNTEKEQL